MCIAAMQEHLMETIWESWDGKSFSNDFRRNAVIFGVDNSSILHTDSLKNIFLVLCEGPIENINGSFGTTVKKYSINFICLLMEKIYVSLKLIIKGQTFAFNFVWEVYLKNVILMNLKKYLFKELFIVFQTITMLLIIMTW